MKNNKGKVIIVTGPTASGKTALALEIAQKLNGELINADSRQIYKYMNIGTNKGKLAPIKHYLSISGRKLQAYSLEESPVPAWLFDLKNPDELFSVSEYLEIVLKVIADIIRRGKLPVVVGGTGLYLDALIKGYSLAPVAPDPKLRAQLAVLSPGELLAALSKLAPVRAAGLNQSDRANPRRLIRAIELARSAVQPKVAPKVRFDILMLYPKLNRIELFNNIDRRVLEMFAQGFIAEVEYLKKLGYGHAPALQGIGYREVLKYLDGEVDLHTCSKLIQQAHRNYAKRQYTWFEGTGRSYQLHRFDFEKQKQEILELVKNFLYS